MTMEKINVAELLKDCPKGMELDCLLCNNPIELEDVVYNEVDSYPIRAVGKDGFHHVFTSYGASYNHNDAKCVIFPKGQTSWEGFVPPCKFKEGDVIFKRNFIAIIHLIEEEGKIWYHCWFNTKYENYKLKKDYGIGNINDGDEVRLATEEEKAELFKVIKENGYTWNEETKKLEKVSQYPQTLEKCCAILGLTELGFIGGYRRGLLTQFRNLLICRDAYWKIAGEEMGLGIPWEPDWKNSEERRYCIVNIEGDINLPEKILTRWILKVTNKILVFPTEEMRDAFYEHFEELIKECKSLL